jgi:hypothetical protein
MNDPSIYKDEWKFNPCLIRVCYIDEKSAGNDNELIFLVLYKGHLSLYFMVLQEEK